MGNKRKKNCGPKFQFYRKGRVVPVEPLRVRHHGFHSSSPSSVIRGGAVTHQGRLRRKRRRRKVEVWSSSSSSSPLLLVGQGFLVDGALPVGKAVVHWGPVQGAVVVVGGPLLVDGAGVVAAVERTLLG